MFTETWLDRVVAGDGGGMEHGGLSRCKAGIHCRVWVYFENGVEWMGRCGGGIVNGMGWCELIRFLSTFMCPVGQASPVTWIPVTALK